jgi:hypothetical protein
LVWQRSHYHQSQLVQHESALADCYRAADHSRQFLEAFNTYVHRHMPSPGGYCLPSSDPHHLGPVRGQ